MLLLAMLSALVLSGIALFAILRAAGILGLMDRPDLRKVHQQITPVVGGIAWFLGVAPTLLFFGVLQTLPWLTVGMALMVLLGGLDDRFHLPTWPRLLAQCGIALMVVLMDGTRLLSLGLLLPGVQVELGVASVAFTVFAWIGVINAFNMIDGIDGLSGSLAVLLLSALAILAWPAHFELALLLAVSAVALLPFLAMNLRLPWQKKAKVFLGDAGSMTLGLLFAYAVTRLSQGEAAVFPPATALWLLALPLIDTVSVMLRRLFSGSSPFAPDQQHIHHLLLRAGLSVSCTVVTLLAAQVAAIGMAYLCMKNMIAAPWQALCFLVLGLCYHLLLGRALRIGRLFGRPLAPSLKSA
jgi:UDP-GlcNAc:undecaprenyl-phosphate GlcNAc-1-phosphate transferase